ncbi:hypothetical protein [Ferviditalea candida]|uniref:Uncharacterized protein n=1 Tax=Ferviditalea candida TaxID=3108399 RepID=A0ABU5ZIH1_9BACL|nr:hypothetical protein [Paenibacillaceae bacterium T2]
MMQWMMSLFRQGNNGWMWRQNRRSNRGRNLSIMSLLTVLTVGATALGVARKRAGNKR